MSKKLPDIADLKRDRIDMDVKGEPYAPEHLSLSGGTRLYHGMSNWDIAEDFIRSGYLPPVRLSLALDMTRDIGATERYIVRCMLRSIQLHRQTIKAEWVRGSVEHAELWGHMAVEKGMLEVRLDRSHGHRKDRTNHDK